MIPTYQKPFSEMKPSEFISQIEATQGTGATFGGRSSTEQAIIEYLDILKAQGKI